MWKLNRLSVPHQINSINVDNYLFDVGQCINHYNNVDGEYANFRDWQCGVSYYLDPLTHYVQTARASVDFLRKLVDAKPFMIARILKKGGNYNEAIDRIKAYLKVE